MGSRGLIALGGALISFVLVAPATGSPAADLESVIRDYSRDAKITPCRFTARQLRTSKSQIGQDVDAYAQGLRPAIDGELRRWKKRRCAGSRGGAGRLRIVAVQPKGTSREESVTIKNVGRKTVRLRGYALRDAGDHVLKLRSGKLKRGAKLRIVTGCRKGHRKAVMRGSRYYTCRSKQVWDDGGDIVELLGPGGGLLSKKTFGTIPAPAPAPAPEPAPEPAATP